MHDHATTSRRRRPDGIGGDALDTPLNAPGKWQAWVDGTAAPNPGRIGLGLLLVSPDGEHRELSRLANRHGCNNEAELLAIDAAIAALLDATSGTGTAGIAIHSDSRFAVDCLAGRDDTAVPRLSSLLAAIRPRLAALKARAVLAEVSLVWVPRHRNSAADRLARAALGLPPKAAAPPHRRRR